MNAQPSTDVLEDYDYLVETILEDEPAHGPFADQHIRPLHNGELAIVIRKYPDVLDGCLDNANEWADCFALSAKTSRPDDDGDSLPFCSFMLQMRARILPLARQFLIDDLNAEVDRRAEAAYDRVYDDGECFRGGEAAAYERDRQAEIMRTLK